MNLFTCKPPTSAGASYARPITTDHYNKKLPRLVSHYLKTNNQHTAQADLAKILKSCSNHALAFGKCTSLEVLKHDCKNLIKYLNQQTDTANQQKAITLHNELAMSLKGIDNRIQSESEYLQEEKAHNTTMSDTAKKLHQMRERLLEKPTILNTQAAKPDD
ncbi:MULTISPECIES: hypothetical protein [unclassified Pseudomonas]|uniref:hypothetical protein n=1 Tax=unclassified Pseudomonas TaxID=196821 RepID=UPI0011AF4507|nr:MULTISPECIES: hypothetical protein [unclassified Pseudomonas]